LPPRGRSHSLGLTAAGKTWDDTANVCGGSETTADRKKEKKKKKRGKHKKDQSRLKEGPPEAD
jgi:hypothetical protein